MTAIALPSSVRIRHIEWTLDRPAQVNRSGYTGTRKVVANPWHGMWRARVELAPVIGEANVRPWRAFLAKLKGQINTFQLPATEGAQNTNYGVTVNSTAAQGATTLPLAGYTTPLRAGQFLTVNGQLCICTADQSGANVTFEPPLRQAAVAGTTVVTSRPYALVALADSAFSYNVDPGTLYGLSFDVEEAILEADGSVPETVGTGTFFDSSIDAFNGAKISVASDATITTSASTIIFNGNTDKDLLGQVKDSGGNIIKSAFTDVTVEATLTVRPLDDTGGRGIFFGLVNNDSFPSNYFWDWAGMVKTAIPFLNTVQGTLWGSASQLAFDSSKSFTPNIVVDVKLQLAGDTITFTINYPSGDTRTLTYNPLTFTAAGGKQMPNMFSSLGFRFGGHADMTLTRLKVYAEFYGAKFGVLGDSIEQGRFASNFAAGWAAQLRALYPGNVLISGAPSAQTSDWKTAAHMTAFNTMAPRYTIIKLGTNDIVNARTVSAIQTDLTAIVNSVIAAGSIPIVLFVPPNGSSNTATLNSWIATQGWRYIDIYTPLLGTGTSLNASYDAFSVSGDHIHPNDAGHDVITSTVNAYILAQGL